MENGVNKASCVRHCSSERNANYWASGSVKCTAVVTVSARWTIELLCNLTVGGVSRSHPRITEWDCRLLPTSISRLIQNIEGFWLNAL